MSAIYQVFNLLPSPLRADEVEDEVATSSPSRLEKRKNKRKDPNAYLILG
jgi:hypothetical protein